QIADGCIARLGGEYGTAEGVRFLSVVSIIAGALAFFPPAAVAAGSVSLAASIYSFIASEVASADDTPEELTIGGYDAPSIIHSTWDAVITLEGQLAKVDQTLSSGLARDLDSEVSFASPGLRIARPDLAD